METILKLWRVGLQISKSGREILVTLISILSNPNEEGKVVCDIMRHENYDEDLRLYLDLPKDFIMPKINVGNYNGVYKEIYTPETIQIVADWHKDDIDYFGFDFDTAATRNYWNEA